MPLIVFAYLKIFKGRLALFYSLSARDLNAIIEVMINYFFTSGETNWRRNLRWTRFRIGGKTKSIVANDCSEEKSKINEYVYTKKLVNI